MKNDHRKSLKELLTQSGFNLIDHPEEWQSFNPVFKMQLQKLASISQRMKNGFRIVYWSHCLPNHSPAWLENENGTIVHMIDPEEIVALRVAGITETIRA